MTLAKAPSRRNTIVTQSPRTLTVNKSLCIEQANEEWRIAMKTRRMRLPVTREERLFALFSLLLSLILIGFTDDMY